MATTSQLVTARAAAITDYASKLAAFRTSYVALAAYDQVLNDPDSPAGGVQSQPGFGPAPDAVLLRHAFAAPTFGGSFQDDIRAQVATVLAAFTAG